MAENRINELRKAQNITLKGLVELLKQKNIKVNASQISSYEKGTTPRNDQIWGALAEIFNTSEAYLRGLTGNDYALQISELNFKETSPIKIIENLNSELERMPSFDEFKKEYRTEANPAKKNDFTFAYVNAVNSGKIDMDALVYITNLFNILDKKDIEKITNYATDIANLSRLNSMVANKKNQ